LIRGRGVKMASNKQGLESSRDVRLYLSYLLAKVEKGELDIKRATALSNIAYKIQMSIAGELKEKELEIAETLREQLDKTQKGV
jgi:predicted transcriptional regulator